MLEANGFAALAAQTRHIAEVGGGEELQVGIDLLGGLAVKAEIAVEDFFSPGITGQEVLGHKGIGLVSALVVDAALPGIQSLFAYGIAGAGSDAGSASIGDGMMK